MAKKIGIRILVVILILLGSQLLYRKVFLPGDLQEHGNMLFKLTEYQEVCDVLYFGESSNFWVNADDTDKRTISEMIADSLDGSRLGTLNHSAFHAGLYLPLVQQIKENSRVKTIIVTMNMRTFDQACIHSNLETALQQQRTFYMPRPALVNRLMVSFNAYDNKSAEERDKEMWYGWEHDTLRFPFEFPYKTLKDWCFAPKHVKPDGTEDFPKRELADHYVKAYAFQIDTLKNPRIRDFDNIVKTAKQKHIRVVFNLLAENMHYADSLVGQELVFLMRQNRDLLVKRYTRMGALVVDNLEAVPGYDFAEKNWTTEHYGQLGRSIIARNVVRELKIKN